jgi:hypothetical protein
VTERRVRGIERLMTQIKQKNIYKPESQESQEDLIHLSKLQH